MILSSVLGGPGTSVTLAPNWIRMGLHAVTTCARGREGNVLDVHDDLKREVAFYNIALDAVRDARDLCKASQTPFQRPEDFFAEMVKTDGELRYWSQAY